ncbi:MAG: hypothetical protein ACOVSW_16825 [Candidatus Kapaibacteriota bacterium]
MNQICPFDGKVCMLGCEPLCASQPEINPAAIAMPDNESFRGIFPPFIESLAERMSAETNFSDEAKINLNIPL